MTVMEIRKLKLQAEQDVNKILDKLAEEIDLKINVEFDSIRVVRTFASDKQVFRTKINIEI